MSIGSKEFNKNSPDSKTPNDKYYNNTLEAEQAPPLVFLSKRQVLEKIPITAPTLWQWVRSSKFPKPRAISPNKVVWIQAEVDAWMQSRPIPRYKP
jgi:predicted DNA-binding transcriptional regulator AlpA